MKSIFTSIIFLSIFLIFLGFYEFNSGGKFVNWKIIVATILIISLIVVRIFFTKTNTGNIPRKK